MIGEVTAMPPQEYEAWLAGGGAGVQTVAATGEQLFRDLSCATCHVADGSGLGPSLVGLSGSLVVLADKRQVVADDNYLRESIMNPQAKVVLGFGPIMPAFQGTIDEEKLVELIAYIKAPKQ